MIDMRKEHAGTDKPLGKPTLITLHWTAGDYDTVFDHYHFCVRGDGEVVQTLSINTKGSHCWKRNTGNIGVSMCAMGSSRYPITDKQRDATARLVAELCGVYGIDPHTAVFDHAHFAKLDDYYPDRWDIGPEFDPLLNKVLQYRKQLVSKAIPNSLVGKIK